MKCAGLTLIELMLALFIFLILATLSVPVWRHFLVDHKMAVLLSQVSQAVYLTRQEAITRAAVVTLCGSADLKTCDGDWHAGMITMLPDTGEVIHQYVNTMMDYSLVWRSSLGHDLSLNFTAEGFTQGQQGTFYLCPPTGGTVAQQLIINRMGRLRVLRASVYPSCSSDNRI